VLPLRPPDHRRRGRERLIPPRIGA
jgi:hypothetical protein